MTDQSGATDLARDLASALERSIGAILRAGELEFHSHPKRPRAGEGGPSLPKGLKVSQMPDEYERINATAMARKSPNQLRKWRVARATSVDTFCKAVGSDCPVDMLTVEHAHALYRYWQRRVLDGEVRINSANRLMRNLSGLYSAIHNHHRLESRNPFTGLNLRGGREGKRLAYSASFVRNYLLAEPALERLNPEARRIVYLIIETGLRPSEACALNSATINLEGPIPFVRVTDDERQTKTPGSIRTVPLVGVALAAMRLQPDGFPRYRDRAGSASATINKALTVLNLRPGARCRHYIRYATPSSIDCGRWKPRRTSKKISSAMCICTARGHRSSIAKPGYNA